MILYYTLGGILIIIALGVWRSYRLRKEVVLLGKDFEQLELRYEAFIHQKKEQLSNNTEELDWELDFIVAEALEYVEEVYNNFVNELDKHYPTSIKIDYKASYFPNLQVHCETEIYAVIPGTSKTALSTKDKENLRTNLREAIRADLELRLINLKKELKQE